MLSIPVFSFQKSPEGPEFSTLDESGWDQRPPPHQQIYYVEQTHNRKKFSFTF